jgi:hypothetical protein
MSNLVVNIDYDGTFAESPSMWSDVICCLASSGAKVVCISNRVDNEENRMLLRSHLPDSVEVVICCGALPKANAACDAGLNVDVWIDDNPTRIKNVAERVRRGFTSYRKYA